MRSLTIEDIKVGNIIYTKKTKWPRKILAFHIEETNNNNIAHILAEKDYSQSYTNVIYARIDLDYPISSKSNMAR